MVLDNAINHTLNPDMYKGFPDHFQGYMVDVRRTQPFERRATKIRTHWISQRVEEYIKEKRTPEVAKKRFFHFSCLNRETALVCYFASSEMKAISSFFDRHASYKSYFFDDAAAMLNKWSTEIHLPFHQLVTQELASERVTNIVKAERIPFPRKNRKGKKTKWINRAIKSFRFDGDLFDRYWTFHFIEYNPRQMTMWKEKQLDVIAKRPISCEIKEYSWRQRKVLELVLFDTILDEIIESTEEILAEVWQSVTGNSGTANTIGSSEVTDYLGSQRQASTFLDLHGLIGELDNNTFLSTSHLWNELQQILQMLGDEIKSNLATINLWKGRHKERTDSPRWTLNDERNYGRAISKLKTSNDYKIHQLQRCSASIGSLNALLTNSLEAMSKELDRRGAYDVRLFTYVTVVFLPVSFATSVYSMNSAPSGDMLYQMSITAIAALFVTMFALVNAQIWDRVLGPVFGICNQITEFIVNPIIKAIYRVILWPCIFVLARYLFFPLQDTLRYQKSPFHSNNGTFLSSIATFGPINKARIDFEASNDYEKEIEQRIVRYEITLEVEEQVKEDVNIGEMIKREVRESIENIISDTIKDEINKKWEVSTEEEARAQEYRAEYDGKVGKRIKRQLEQLVDYQLQRGFDEETNDRIENEMFINGYTEGRESVERRVTADIAKSQIIAKVERRVRQIVEKQVLQRVEKEVKNRVDKEIKTRNERKENDTNEEKDSERERNKGGRREREREKEERRIQTEAKKRHEKKKEEKKRKEEEEGKKEEEERTRIEGKRRRETKDLESGQSMLN